MNFVKKGEYAICNIDLGERMPLVREGGADAIRRHSGREMKGRITDWHGMMKGCCLFMVRNKQCRWSRQE